MTRINTHLPMLDEHLRAAKKEYCRIPNSVLKYANIDALNKLDAKIAKQPKHYTVRLNANPSGGKGHMTFFFNKLAFVYQQYLDVLIECERRGFMANSWWPNMPETTNYLFNAWTPTRADIELCVKRQIERIPGNPHYFGERISREEAEALIRQGAKLL